MITHLEDLCSSQLRIPQTLNEKICCFYLLSNNFPLFVGAVCLSLFCYALFCVHSSFAIILKRKRKLFALLLLSYMYICIVTVNVMRLFITVPWVGLQCVFVVFHDHTHLLICGYSSRFRRLVCIVCYWYFLIIPTYFFLALPHSSVGWSAVCDCGISRPYSLFFLTISVSCYNHIKACVLFPFVTFKVER